MTYRQLTLKTGTKIFLGKDAKTNDELVKQFQGKENIILHTVAPGSPFCVIEDLEPTKKEIKQAAIYCASKSQDYRDNKKTVKLHQFTGKDVHKTAKMKTGTWSLKSKPKVIKAKRRDIKLWQSKNSK